MKISIVTISFNQVQYLKECIESIVSQNNTDLEYIIVDAGSTDGSRELISSYSEIKKIFKPDDGPADGLNRGFSLATGEIFGFINADDFLLPGALESVEKQFVDRESSFISGQGFRMHESEYKLIKPSELTLSSLLYRNAVLFQQSTFFNTCWDYELYVDILESGIEHELISDELAVFRVHADSITGSGRLNEPYKNDLRRIFKKQKSRDYGIRDATWSMISRGARKITNE